MKFYSTKNVRHIVDLKTAVFHSLPPDGGLYMPAEILGPSKQFIDTIENYSFREIAFNVANPFLKEDLSEADIHDIIDHTIAFHAPLYHLTDNMSILELWHGPSLAFKDFGARFMARLMAKLVEDNGIKLTILVATSGDTGGAVASGFLGLDNVDVIILFPKNKVSPLQERQLTCLGENITAVEIEGTFDDCQRLVKSAFLDKTINLKYALSSANSINISRLLPQSFYYFEAYKQFLGRSREKLAFSVPSGNFGNLTAGLLAQRMGLPVDHFVAATNINDVIPVYLKTGRYEAKASVHTISNAMDVGNPSNFDRILDLFGGSYSMIKEYISGYAFSDVETKKMITDIYTAHSYIMDPHTAIGCLAGHQFLVEHTDYQVITLSTAHPAKFLPVMEPLVGKLDIPEALSSLDDRKRSVVNQPNDFAEFKSWMLSRF